MFGSLSQSWCPHMQFKSLPQPRCSQMQFGSLAQSWHCQRWFGPCLNHSPQTEMSHDSTSTGQAPTQCQKLLVFTGIGKVPFCQLQHQFTRIFSLLKCKIPGYRDFALALAQTLSHTLSLRHQPPPGIFQCCFTQKLSILTPGWHWIPQT